ncbi:MAG TPA: nuclear transport factor 2 family protein [Chryseolinea sp.]|nr:nuclear transport factor 2 family protein [Chryseolinea sp.]
METQAIPASVKSLIDAQQRHDNEAYAKCFAPNAKVFDEGRTHEGYDEIKRWITDANSKYNTVMQAIDYRENSSGGVLTAEISGTFQGSPVVLTYHLKFDNSLISSLKITG